MHVTDKKANIICLSNQLWDYPLWTNKKHVMTRLAQHDFNVLFVDPPINTGRLFFKHVRAGRWPIKRLLSKTYKSEGATIYSPLNSTPASKRSTMNFINKIKELGNKLFDPKLKTILWVYHVELEYLSQYLDDLNYDVLVYDCVDNYAAFPKYDTQAKKDQLRKTEEILARRADIVFATAPGLVDRLSKLNPKTFYTPNVGDYKKFANVKERIKTLPDDIRTIPRPRIGFTGAFDDYKFDKELMKKLVEDYPSYSFVLIGPAALKDTATSLKALGLGDKQNVYHLGVKDFNDTPGYYAGFDVMIIPYRLNDYTVGGCFPVKFHEGLAVGLPVVVTDLPAYRPFSEYCYIAKSYNEFSQCVRRALEEDSPEKIKQRQAIARENTWDKKVAKMIDLIDTKVKTL